MPCVTTKSTMTRTISQRGMMRNSSAKRDRKSTRLNSSHGYISYAVFCLKKKTKVILITSALPSEGKSTVAANLARTLALGGSQVLLVDSDLRRGALHKRLGVQLTPGLTE